MENLRLIRIYHGFHLTLVIIVTELFLIHIFDLMNNTSFVLAYWFCFTFNTKCSAILSVESTTSTVEYDPSRRHKCVRKGLSEPTELT